MDKELVESLKSIARLQVTTENINKGVEGLNQKFDVLDTKIEKHIAKEIKFKFRLDALEKKSNKISIEVIANTKLRVLVKNYWRLFILLMSFNIFAILQFLFNKF